MRRLAADALKAPKDRREKRPDELGARAVDDELKKRLS
jgi:hypothetical protein